MLLGSQARQSRKLWVLEGTLFGVNTVGNNEEYTFYSSSQASAGSRCNIKLHSGCAYIR